MPQSLGSASCSIHFGPFSEVPCATRSHHLSTRHIFPYIFNEKYATYTSRRATWHIFSVFYVLLSWVRIICSTSSTINPLILCAEFTASKGMWLIQLADHLPHTMHLALSNQKDSFLCKCLCVRIAVDDYGCFNVGFPIQF